ncbi:MAG: methyltransferase domain-containing protein [Chitinivibrionales bacterium]|nr:methyltransferase domain-containing protein [Chitinivibrionales bacterium]
MMGILMRFKTEKIMRRIRKIPLINSVYPWLYAIVHKMQQQFECPMCSYKGPFMNTDTEYGKRMYSTCPQCGSGERHRLAWLVMKSLFEAHDLARMSMLHIAPEQFFRKQLRPKFKTYTTLDLFMKNVDHKADITDMPFGNDCFDFIFAAHVIEHVKDDLAAFKEVSRVLSPGGFALIHVPVIAEYTFEYPDGKIDKCGHARIIGQDYYEKYSSYFADFKLFKSSDFSLKYQTWIYENPSCNLSNEYPEVTLFSGEKHEDLVAIYYK